MQKQFMRILIVNITFNKEKKIKEMLLFGYVWFIWGKNLRLK